MTPGEAVIAVFLFFVGVALVLAWRAIQAMNRPTSSLRGVPRHVADSDEARVMINPEGLILDVSPPVLPMFGYTTEELIGQNVKVLMPPPYHDEHDGYLRNYCETGVRKIIGIGRDIQCRHRSGQQFPARLTVSEVKRADGSVSHFLGALEETTRKEWAKEKARAEAEAEEIKRLSPKTGSQSS
jgi:PAS domain S-box-containing protein